MKDFANASVARSSPFDTTWTLMFPSPSPLLFLALVQPQAPARQQLLDMLQRCWFDLYNRFNCCGSLLNMGSQIDYNGIPRNQSRLR